MYFQRYDLNLSLFEQMFLNATNLDVSLFELKIKVATNVQLNFNYPCKFEI
jgi:hypothetical protein